MTSICNRAIVLALESLQIEHQINLSKLYHEADPPKKENKSRKSFLHHAGRPPSSKGSRIVVFGRALTDGSQMLLEPDTPQLGCISCDLLRWRKSHLKSSVVSRTGPKCSGNRKSKTQAAGVVAVLLYEKGTIKASKHVALPRRKRPPCKRCAVDWMRLQTFRLYSQAAKTGSLKKQQQQQQPPKAVLLCNIY